MTTITNIVAAAILVAGLHAPVAGAQSVVGQWNGTTTTQQGTLSVTFTFDSLAAGWKGSWASESYGAGPLNGVGLKADTVNFSLNIENTVIEMQGTLSPDRKSMSGYIWVGGNDGGTFKVTRAEPAKAPPPPR